MSTSDEGAGAEPADPAGSATGSADPADPAEFGVLEAAARLRSGELGAAELLAAVLARIDACNGPVSFDGAPDAVNAWVRLYPELAAEQARAADRRLARARRDGDEPHVLTGIPLGLKDLFAVRGLPLTASSRVLDGSGGFAPNIATEDSTVWARLAAAGTVLVGHTHTHEFAAGVVTPQCGNPWDLARTTGGSSGGSAAALAARMVPLATGSDTAGSLRIPASCCGVSSLKPTYGGASGYGVIPLAFSLDHMGMMARSLADVAAAVPAFAGPDPADPATYAVLSGPLPTVADPGPRPLAGRRLGVLDVSAAGLTSGVGAVYERFQAELAGLGAELVPVAPPPDPLQTDPTLTGLLRAELAAAHRELYAERGPLYGTGMAGSIRSAREVAMSADDYLRAQQARTASTASWLRIFAESELDAVISPSLVAEPLVRADAVARPETTATVTLLMSAWNRTGFPVAATPAGLSPDLPLPVGMQIVGRPRDEAGVLGVGVTYQTHFPYWADRPPLLG